MPNNSLNLNNSDDSKIFIYKGINPADVNITPYFSYKKWTITSGSSTSSCLPLTAIYSNKKNLPALGTELTYNDAKNIDNSLQTITYYSINNLFYTNKFDYKTLGPDNINKTKKFLYQSASILSIPMTKIGLNIKPTSFELTSSIHDIHLKTDIYGNVYNSDLPISSLIDNCIFYEGFNEYFDLTRIPYEYSNINIITGVTASDGSKLPIGYACKFNGNGYISASLDYNFTRDNDYAISFFISASTNISDQLILGKLKSTDTQYPFKIELTSTGKIKYSASSNSTLKNSITSSVLPAGWNHVVCQKSGSYMQLYLNETLITSSINSAFIKNTSPTSNSGQINNSNSLYIGGFSPNSSCLTADLDEIRVFNTNLNLNSIRALNNRSETGSLLQTNVVGNIFYNHGLIVLSSPNYIYNNLINSPYTASYRSSVKMHEFNTTINVKAGEFNLSNNSTLLKDDLESYDSFVTSSLFNPYITTIGLYNNDNELLAVAKLAQPIKKRKDIDLNFLIRIDLDHEFNNK